MSGRAGRRAAGARVPWAFLGSVIPRILRARPGGSRGGSKATPTTPSARRLPTTLLRRPTNAVGPRAPIPRKAPASVSLRKWLSVKIRPAAVRAVMPATDVIVVGVHVQNSSSSSSRSAGTNTARKAPARNVAEAVCDDGNE